MLGKDEKLLQALIIKFHQELVDLDNQIEALQERRIELVALLAGRSALDMADPVFEETAEAVDSSLVDLLSTVPVKRSDINEFFASWGLSPDDVRKALQRCKSRGLIQSEGKGRAAVWFAI